MNQMHSQTVQEMKSKKKVMQALHIGRLLGPAALCLLAGALLFPLPARAAGNLTVTDKKAFILSGKDSGYFYAKIENDGDEPAAVDHGKLVLFSEDDDILETSDYISTFPSRLVLEPGEYTYVSEFLWNSNLKNQTIGDMKFSVGITDRGTEAERIPCEIETDIKGSAGLDNYLRVTLKNEADEVRSGYCLVAALYDTEGSLVYVDRASYDNIGLHPGSTMTVSMYVDLDVVNYFESNHIEIGSADVLAYYVQK